MNVLVTGGAGYIGSVAVRQLLEGGHTVRVVDALWEGAHGLRGLEQAERFSLFQGDIRSAAVVRKALEGMEAVVHLAAIVGDPACDRDPALTRQVNAEASLQLWDLSRRSGVSRFLFASTCSNYGRMRDPDAWLTEEAELRPLSLYARTKVEVERVLLGPSASEAPPRCVMRFATVFGLSPRMRFDLTVNEFTRELVLNRRLVIYGEQFWRPYVHVVDAARAIRLILESPSERVRGQAFNVGDTTQNYRKADLVELICARLGEPAQIERVEKIEDPRNYRVSFEKVQRLLGFRITRTVPDGIREMMDAIRHGRLAEVGEASSGGAHGDL
jgi:nucleoside-diphosphate-sugar epimerase